MACDFGRDEVAGDSMTGTFLLLVVLIVIVCGMFAYVYATDS